MLSRIFPLIAPSLGCSAKMVTSMLTGRKPARFRRRTASSTKLDACVLVTRICIREQVADVAEASGAEKSIRDRVQHDVGVAVTEKPLGMRNHDAAQDERPPIHEPVRIVSAAHAHRGIHSIPKVPSPA